MMTCKKRFTLRKLVITGILGGISAILGLTPLGFIPVGLTKATIMHIPVIIGAIMEGPLVGGLVGLIFGLFSMFQALTNPTPISFVFLNPLVSILPRVLIGIVSYYVYKLFKTLGKKTSSIIIYAIWGGITAYLVKVLVAGILNKSNIGMLIVNGVLIVVNLFAGLYIYKGIREKAAEVAVSAALGTLTNTVGVLLSIYLLYGQQFVEAMELDSNTANKVILGIGITNGIPEMIVAIIIVTSVVAGLNKRR
ncbi:MAG TPA: ECF transporter S component [Tissierellales bacterium]|nr:ECF transporter S component [Tissierellales bacterium]